jgi:hypothetical protein
MSYKPKAERFERARSRNNGRSGDDKTELKWWELPGCIYHITGLGQAEGFPEFFARLDADFWTALEQAGKITLSRDNRERLANILYVYSDGEKSEFAFKVWGAGLTKREKIAQWSAVARHAGALRAAIQILPEYDSHKLAETCGHSLRVITGLLEEFARVAEEKGRLARLEKRQRGRPPDDWTGDLVCSVALLYRRAGGKVAASWSSDQATLAGPFPAFLRLIWERLPSDIRPVTAEAFARRARGLPDIVRGKGENWLLLGKLRAVPNATKQA